MTLRYTIIDFETTRPPSGGGLRAVEIALVRVSEEGIEERFASLINPQCRIDPFSHSVHHISDRMVRDQPSFADLWPRLREEMEGAALLAHYAPFDAGVLRDEIHRLGLEPPAVEWLCSCRLAQRVWPALGCHKLGFLRDALSLCGNNSHRAEEDALLTANLVNKALAELRTRELSAHPRELLTRHAAIQLAGSWPFRRQA